MYGLTTTTGTLRLRFNCSVNQLLINNASIILCFVAFNSIYLFNINLAPPSHLKLFGEVLKLIEN